MKTSINYSLVELDETYKQIRHVLGGYVLCGANEGLIKEIACNIFLHEAYELEVTKHGGLDIEKIEEYKALCRKFLKLEEEII